MPLFLRLCYRNLWRNRRRTRLTMSAMIAATALLVFTLGMYEGMMWDIVNNATELIQGHITLARQGYLEHPTLHDSFADNPDLWQRIRDLPGVKGACGRLSCFALLSCGEGKSSHTHPAELLGIDPQEEMKYTRLPRAVIKGTFLSATDGNGMVLGKGLARRLAASIGQEVVIMGQAADGSTVGELYQVTGILDTADSNRDSTLALVGRRTLQRQFCLENRLHKVGIFLKHPLTAPTIAARFPELDHGLEVTPWQQRLPQIAQIFTIWAAIQVFTMIIYYFAVFLVSFSTMYMAFLERMREFAILGAIGLTPNRLAAMILLEGVLLSSLSAAAGTTLGVMVCQWLNWYPISIEQYLSPISYAGSSITPRIYCQLTFFNTFMPCLAMVVLGMVVALLPAWRLRGLRPVEALREV